MDEARLYGREVTSDVPPSYPTDLRTPQPDLRSAVSDAWPAAYWRTNWRTAPKTPANQQLR